MSSPAIGSAPRPALAALRWIATLASSITAILLLHRLGNTEAFAVEWSTVWTWIGAHSAERVLMAAGRLVALGLAYWVAGSLLAATAARASGVPALIRSADWLTLPAIRRMAERTVAVTLAASTFAGSGAGMVMAADPSAPHQPQAPLVQEVESSPVPRYVPVPAGDPPTPTPEERTEPSYVPTPAGEAQPLPVAPSPTGTVAPPTDTAPEVGPRRLHPAAADVAPLRQARVRYDYTVVPGDNLWLIAGRHLVEVLDRQPNETETATYWAHLVATNRSGLRSGDPDLIYPGEIVTCPPTTDVGIGA